VLLIDEVAHNVPRTMRRRIQSRIAFSVIEVLVIVAVIALMVVIVLPMLARARVKNHGMSCTVCLKQVGLSYRLWSNDHNDEFPFSSTNVESSLAWVNSPQVFRHYQVLSNELVTPKVLLCPRDVKRRWPDPSGGVLDFRNLANANVSYFVGLDAREDNPRQFLSGDRNITGGALSNGFLRTLTPTTAAGWTKDIHKFAGNIGLADGSVQQFTTNGLRQHLATITNATIRLAIP
jgi:competence protein ComGC